MTTPAAGHRIRLRGPWKIARTDDRGQVIGEVEIRKHPEDWPQVVDSRPGRVLLTRTFHAPSNLDDTETVFVVLTGVRGEGDVYWNGQMLGEFSMLQTEWEFLILPPMPFTNELSITVSFAAPTPSQPQVGVYGDVALEIRTVASPAAEATANQAIRS